MTITFTKVEFRVFAALLSIAAAGLFAVQGDDRGFRVERGEAFYVQVAFPF